MILAADNLNPLNPVVAAALKNLQPQPLPELARRLEQTGAGLTFALAEVLQPELMETVRLIKQMN